MDDLLVGRKQILSYLRRADWNCIKALITQGAPIIRVGGVWELRTVEYEDWRKKMVEAAVSGQGPTTH